MAIEILLELEALYDETEIKIKNTSVDTVHDQRIS